MKIFANATLALVSSLALVSPAIAQETTSTQPTTYPTPTPTPAPGTPTCFGNLCNGDTLTVTAFGGVTRAGTSGAMFDAGEHGIGEAGASSEGVDSVDIAMYLNTCEEGCESNGFEATLMGRQQNQSYAWGMSDQSAQPVYASTLGVSAVVIDFGVGNNACPGGCPAPTGSASD